MFREGRQFLKKTKYKTSTQLMERMKKRVSTGLNAFFHLEPHIFEQISMVLCWQLQKDE